MVKIKIVNLILAVSIILNLGLGIFAYITHVNKQNAEKTFNQELKQIQDYFNEYLEYGSWTDGTLSLYQISVGLMTKNIFDAEKNAKYHSFGCPYMRGKDVWFIYKASGLRELGFEPCSLCDTIFRRDKLSNDFIENAKRYFYKDYIIMQRK